MALRAVVNMTITLDQLNGLNIDEGAFLARWKYGSTFRGETTWAKAVNGTVSWKRTFLLSEISLPRFTSSNVDNCQTKEYIEFQIFKKLDLSGGLEDEDNEELFGSLKVEVCFQDEKLKKASIQFSRGMGGFAGSLAEQKLCFVVLIQMVEVMANTDGLAAARPHQSVCLQPQLRSTRPARGGYAASVTSLRSNFSEDSNWSLRATAMGRQALPNNNYGLWTDGRPAVNGRNPNLINAEEEDALSVFSGDGEDAEMLKQRLRDQIARIQMERRDFLRNRRRQQQQLIDDALDDPMNLPVGGGWINPRTGIAAGAPQMVGTSKGILASVGLPDLVYEGMVLAASVAVRPDVASPNQLQLSFDWFRLSPMGPVPISVEEQLVVDCSLVGYYVGVRVRTPYGDDFTAISKEPVQAAKPVFKTLRITGAPCVGSKLGLLYDYVGGVQSPPKVSWFSGGQPREAFANRLHYLVTEADLNQHISVSVTPVRGDGVCGQPKTATTPPVRMTLDSETPNSRALGMAGIVGELYPGRTVQYIHPPHLPPLTSSAPLSVRWFRVRPGSRVELTPTEASEFKYLIKASDAGHLLQVVVSSPYAGGEYTCTTPEMVRPQGPEVEIEWKEDCEFETPCVGSPLRFRVTLKRGHLALPLIRWFRLPNLDVPVATGASSYTPTEDDIGHKLRVQYIPRGRADNGGAGTFDQEPPLTDDLSFGFNGIAVAVGPAQILETGVVSEALPWVSELTILGDPFVGSTLSIHRTVHGPEGGHLVEWYLVDPATSTPSRTIARNVPQMAIPADCIGHRIAVRYVPISPTGREGESFIATMPQLVAASASGGGGDIGVASSATTIGRNLRVVGDPVVGRTLAISGNVAPDSKFVWYRDTKVVPGAVGSTYTCSEADLGCIISCGCLAAVQGHYNTLQWNESTRVSASRPVEMVSSAPIVAPREISLHPPLAASGNLVNLPPIVQRHFIDGAPEVGRILTAIVDVFSPSGAPLGNPKIQWYCGDHVIPEANDSLTYRCTEDDLNYVIGFEYTPTTVTGLTGNTVYATTATPVRPISFKLSQVGCGKFVTADFGDLLLSPAPDPNLDSDMGGAGTSSSNQPTNTFIWWRSIDGVDFQKIVDPERLPEGGGARLGTEPRYLATADDLNHFIRCELTRIDSKGNPESFSTHTRIVRLHLAYKVELQKLLESGRVGFDVFLVGESRNATLVLDHKRVAILVDGTAMVKAEWSTNCSASLCNDSAVGFVLRLNGKQSYVCNVPKATSRDIAVLCFRAYMGMALDTIAPQVIDENVFAHWKKGEFRENGVKLMAKISAGSPGSFIAMAALNQREALEQSLLIQRYGLGWWQARVTLEYVLTPIAEPQQQQQTQT